MVGRPSQAASFAPVCKDTARAVSKIAARFYYVYNPKPMDSKQWRATLFRYAATNEEDERILESLPDPQFPIYSGYLTEGRRVDVDAQRELDQSDPALFLYDPDKEVAIATFAELPHVFPGPFVWTTTKWLAALHDKQLAWKYANIYACGYINVMFSVDPKSTTSHVLYTGKAGAKRRRTDIYL